MHYVLKSFLKATKQTSKQTNKMLKKLFFNRPFSLEMFQMELDNAPSEYACKHHNDLLLIFTFSSTS